MASETLTVLVYSDDASTRDAVRLALGRRPAADLPALEYVECATEWAANERLRQGGVDLAILDGEAAPAGGLGLCRTVKAEIFSAPPILVLLGRPQDGWLAAWSGADGVAHHPLDPVATAAAAAQLLRTVVAPAGSAVVPRA
jgi:DNA-binding response OmpR family regulator